MLRRIKPVALLLALALLVGGCTQGGSDSADDFEGEQKAVAEVIDDLSRAASRADGTEICEDIYSDSYAKAIAARDARRSCGEVIEEALDDTDRTKMTVKRVTVAGSRATAVVESEVDDETRTDTFTLTRETTGSPPAAEWRIAGIS